MQLASAILCDFAQVREGLLFVSGGGITRIWRETFPAAAGVSLALVFEAHPTHARTLRFLASDKAAHTLNPN